jgi:hypothetical protein
MPSKARILFSDPRAMPFLLKKVAKFFIDKGQWIEGKLLTAVGVIDFKVPPNSSMRESSSTNIRHNYESGLTTTISIVTAAYLQELDLRQPADVLDFGRGVGRQLLQLARRYPKQNLHACDVNGRSIAYLQRAYPKIESYANAFSPHSSFPTPNSTFFFRFRFFSFEHQGQSDLAQGISQSYSPGRALLPNDPGEPCDGVARANVRRTI